MSERMEGTRWTWVQLRGHRVERRMLRRHVESLDQTALPVLSRVKESKEGV